jgi:hypothetical protein
MSFSVPGYFIIALRCYLELYYFTLSSVQNSHNQKTFIRVKLSSSSSQSSVLTIFNHHVRQSLVLVQVRLCNKVERTDTRFSIHKSSQAEHAITVTTGSSLVTTGKALVTTGKALVTTGRSLVITGKALVTTKRSLVTTKRSLVTTGSSLVTTKRSLVTTGKALVTTKRSLVITGSSLVTTGRSLVITGKALVTTGRSLVITIKVVKTRSIFDINEAYVWILLEKQGII